MEIFAPPTIAASGRSGCVERLVEGFEFGLHGAPGVGGKLVAETFSRRVRAMRGRERVVDPDVAELGQRGDEGRIVLFFAGMEAGVFETQNVAGLHGGDRALGRLADAVVGEFHRALDDARDLGGDRLERLFRVAPLRPAEMREQDDLAALVGDFGDRRRRALDAGGVGDDAVLHRHVEVDAHQDAFALHVDVVERAKRIGQYEHPARCRRATRAQISLPIATAVSAMRLEKPHSLSYQDITRTKVPSMTLVWSMWKIEERGSWLKSSETFGSLV